MTTTKSFLSRSSLFGLGLTFIALILSGCGKGGSSSSTNNTNNNSATPTAAIKITPMKGQFSEGTTVKVKRAKDSVEVGTCAIDATGSCSANVKTTETGPFLIEAGIAGDKYFDESKGAIATVPAGQPALRALIPNATAAVGVTALTELAVGQIEGNTGGIAAAKVTDVIAANATIGSQFGVPYPLATPSVIGAGTATAKLTGNNNADDYALKLAAIAKMTKAGGDPIQALHDLRDDIKDGVLDGQKNGVAVTTLNIPTPAAGQTHQQAMNTELNNLLVVATTAYATPGVVVPTVTMTVADLKVLLDAAMQVGAATQAASAGTAMTAETLNTQIANTVQTQVATLAVTGATAGTIQAGTAAAVTAGTTAGTTLQNASGWAKDFLAAAATGVYQAEFQLNAAAGTSLNWGRLQKKTLTPNGALYDMADVTQQYNNGGVAGWQATTATPAGTYWDLSRTSAGGWVDTSTAPMNFTIAADGTFTVHNLMSNGSSMGSSWSMQVTQVDLSGKPVEGCSVSDNMGNRTPCTIAPYGAATYPAGSTGFRFSDQFRNNDQYSVDIWQVGSAATDVNGNPLTALPALGDSFCMPNGGGFYQAVPGAVNYTHTQKWIGAGGCTAANITTAAAQQGGGQVLLSVKGTGNGQINVLLFNQLNCMGCGNEQQIIAYIPTKGVFQGWFQPAGASLNSGSNIMTNKTAFDAMIAAAKAVTGITGMGQAVPTLP